MGVWGVGKREKETVGNTFCVLKIDGMGMRCWKERESKWTIKVS